jgi:hypothetical protein
VGELDGRATAQFQEVVGFALYIRLDLEKKGWNKVESYLCPRPGFKTRYHVGVSLDSMEPDPGHRKAICYWVKVQRLMHMPKEGNI